MTDKRCGITGDADSEGLDTKLSEAFKNLGIPPRPAILQHLANEMRKPEPDFNRVAQLISRDVGLAAGLVKTVNSPYYGLRRKVRTVHEALIMRGLASVSQVIAGLALRQAFPAGPHLERFWDAADRTAQLSAWLVYALGIKYGIDTDDAYTYALFRDCGIPILMRRFPEYKVTLAQANSNQSISFTDVEDARLPCNHAVVGSLMTEGWSLPGKTSAAIRQHHNALALNGDLPLLSSSSTHLIALAQLAEHFFQEASGMSRNVEWTKLGEGCLQRLGLEGQHLPSLQLRATAFLDSIVTL